jgi:hypothetical protein
LFGLNSYSRVPHEIDGAASTLRGSLVLECKATEGGITKADAALFHFKVMDFYRENIEAASRERWWPLLCGANVTSISGRASAISLGLLLCDRGRLPLPVLVRAAGRPMADMRLPQVLLQEIVRLGERALLSQQARWRYRAQYREISFDAGDWKKNEIQDLLWLEDELSFSVLELYERRNPGVLEQRATSLLERARKAA